MPSGAEKLLERKQRSKAGWKRNDLETLYEGFGFVLKHGGKHDHYRHPDYPELRDTLKRSRSVPEYNVRNAVNLIKRLKVLEEAATSDDS